MFPSLNVFKKFSHTIECSDTRFQSVQLQNTSSCVQAPAARPRQPWSESTLDPTGHGTNAYFISTNHSLGQDTCPKVKGQYHDSQALIKTWLSQKKRDSS